jgi:hypothetical protein
MTVSLHGLLGDDFGRLGANRVPSWGTTSTRPSSLAGPRQQVALTTLLERCPGLHLAVTADQLDWKTGMAVRGLVAALPVG